MAMPRATLSEKPFIRTQFHTIYANEKPKLIKKKYSIAEGLSLSAYLIINFYLHVGRLTRQLELIDYYNVCGWRRDGVCILVFVVFKFKSNRIQFIPLNTMNHKYGMSCIELFSNCCFCH